jgi:hypothetical protein
MFSNYTNPFLMKDLYYDSSVFKIRTLVVQTRMKETEMILTNY